MSFNEETLQADIHRVWGEHGVHADVYAAVLRQAMKASELEEAGREVIRAANRDPDECENGRTGWAEAMSNLSRLVFPMEEVR